MSRASRRAAARELEAAKVLGTKRVHRSRYERAPDVQPLRLPSGHVLQLEIKTRAKPVALIAKALEQATTYTPSAVPVAVISSTGGHATACIPLAAFAEIIGVRAPKIGAQLALLGGRS